MIKTIAFLLTLAVIANGQATVDPAMPAPPVAHRPPVSGEGATGSASSSSALPNIAAIFSACSADITSYCSGQTPEECLSRSLRLSLPQLSEGCRAALTQEMPCIIDAASLCGSSASSAREIASCLLSLSASDLSPQCVSWIDARRQELSAAASSQIGAAEPAILPMPAVDPIYPYPDDSSVSSPPAAIGGDEDDSDFQQDNDNDNDNDDDDDDENEYGHHHHHHHNGGGGKHGRGGRHHWRGRHHGFLFIILAVAVVAGAVGSCCTLCCMRRRMRRHAANYPSGGGCCSRRFCARTAAPAAAAAAAAPGAIPMQQMPRQGGLRYAVMTEDISPALPV